MKSALVFLALVAIVSAQNYCNQRQCVQNRRTHTMCLYTNPNPSPACGKVSAVGITEGDKAAIVRKHNELRALVASGRERRGNPGPQPAAKYMPNLTWNNELAAIAQRWANQCKFGHDSCRDVDRYSVGQNVAIQSTTGADNFKAESLVLSWYNEVAKFNRADVRKYVFSADTGHYTQLVWANTTEIGCGRVRYNKDGWNSDYLVCNYGPAGNWIGQPIYQTR